MKMKMLDLKRMERLKELITIIMENRVKMSKKIWMLLIIIIRIQGKIAKIINLINKEKAKLKN